MDETNHAPGEATAEIRPARRRSRVTMIAAGVLAGGGAGLAAVLAYLIMSRAPAAPEISRADLLAAEQKWERAGPKSYDMDLQIGGRQPGPVHIEVRQGQVTRMTRDGVTPAQRRTWEYWTVPEQFETIRQDFDSSERPGGFGAAPGTETILKAEFDPQYGYPRRYQRFVLGTDLDVEWTVTAFQVAD